MSLQVGISTPWDLWDLRPAQQRARLATIADAGIDHIFTADHVSFLDGGGMDALVHLAALGAMEPRLKLHAGVFLLALRYPMVAARQISSLEQTAPGRVTIGVGVGGEDRHEFEVCEVDPATRGRRTDAALEIVRRLLDGETVAGDGEFFSFERGQINPVPGERVPFLIGGRSNAALRRTAAFGDGWLGAWCSARRFREATQLIAEFADDRAAAWTHGVQLWVGVGDRQHVANAMAEFYGLDFEVFERYTPVGDAERIAEFLFPYLDAGAQILNLTAVGANREVETEAVAEVRRLLMRGEA